MIHGDSYMPSHLSGTLSPLSSSPSSVLDEFSPAEKEELDLVGRGDPSWVARPRNAFIIFRCEYARLHSRMGKRIKRGTGAPTEKSLSKRAAEAWHQLSREEKNQFKVLADQERDEHARLHPDYRFRPMKRLAPRKRSPHPRVASSVQRHEEANATRLHSELPRHSLPAVEASSTPSSKEMNVCPSPSSLYLSSHPLSTSPTSKPLSVHPIDTGPQQSCNSDDTDSPITPLSLGQCENDTLGLRSSPDSQPLDHVLAVPPFDNSEPCQQQPVSRTASCSTLLAKWDNESPYRAPSEPATLDTNPCPSLASWTSSPLKADSCAPSGVVGTTPYYKSTDDKNYGSFLTLSGVPTYMESYLPQVEYIHADPLDFYNPLMNSDAYLYPLALPTSYPTMHEATLHANSLPYET
ncbi:hypothetical protein AMATHDRAFT_47060 [Amanita thiersii Skay4041]|uniref:HMG box domain-containing protein n=1 Tax=Amanita thiersii Skay4041 TaxID=703135 RepID=A0A2A9NUU1_9AGAR|nr:hypothetical protein AMATHDRAFT_47060 [Amanita thiersii Skay4041]